MCLVIESFQTLPNKVHLVGNIFLKYTDGPRRGLWYFEVDVFLSWVKSWRLRLWCLTPLSTIFQLYHGGRVKSWIIPLRGEVCANKTSLTPPLFIDVSIPSQIVIMYLCVKGIDFHLSTILILYFRIVLTMACLLYILFFKYVSGNCRVWICKDVANVRLDDTYAIVPHDKASNDIFCAQVHKGWDYLRHIKRVHIIC